MDLMYAGEPLDAAGVECDGYLELLQRWGLENSGEVVRIVRQASRCLQVPASDPTVLAGDSFDEAAELPGIIATKNFSSVSLVHVMKAMLAVLFRAPGAAAVAEAGEAWIVTQVGQQSAVVHNFYLSLALLSACRAAAPEERARLLDKIEKNQQALRLWADGAPMNHEHRFRLVEAVRASVRGDDQAAMKLYEEAAEGALRNRYLQDEAWPTSWPASTTRRPGESAWRGRRSSTPPTPTGAGARRPRWRIWPAAIPRRSPRPLPAPGSCWPPPPRRATRGPSIWRR
jgi:hypothetical protein